MIDFKKVPLPPPVKIDIKASMSPKELSAAVQQIDLWTRQARAFMTTLRDAVIELQNK
jgi:hypothetical protein